VSQADDQIHQAQVREPVGDPQVGTTSADIEQEEYKVISYCGALLPKNYRNMVFSRWLRSLRFGNRYFKIIDQEPYFRVYHAFIESILAKQFTTVKLAVITNEPDVCFGWSVCEPQTLHYVHVQRDYRQSGIGTSLIPKDIKTITHVTNAWEEIWHKYPHTKFNPF
jgi:hypothetical protein